MSNKAKSSTRKMSFLYWWNTRTSFRLRVHSQFMFLQFDMSFCDINYRYSCRIRNLQYSYVFNVWFVYQFEFSKQHYNAFYITWVIWPWPETSDLPVLPVSEISATSYLTHRQVVSWISLNHCLKIQSKQLLIIQVNVITYHTKWRKNHSTQTEKKSHGIPQHQTPAMI